MAAPAQSNSAAERWLSKAELPPPFVAPVSLQAWTSQRAAIRTELWKLLGHLPPRPAVPDVHIVTNEDRGDYELQKFEFANGAGDTVPGYLLIPKRRQGKAPAILYCHWHAGEYDLGKNELFEARHTPESPGPALAKQGYIVLAIDACCFGERNGRGPGGPREKGKEGESSAAKFNLWVGRTLWGMMIRDDLMALDYLASRPEVDSTRIGAMGMSMGATRCWWLMALDDRIRTSVPVCCLTRGRNLVEHELLQAHGIYFFVPGFLSQFDAESVVALIAPRPILFLNGDRDTTSPVDGIHAIEAAVRPVYRLYGKENEFQSVVYTNQGHLYTPEMWQRTLTWLDEKLKNAH